MIFLFLAVEIITDVEYAVVDGKSLKLDLYLPDDRRTPVPAVICIHGGGWSKGDKKDVRIARSLAQNGLAAVCVNYRLSGEAKYPAAVDDCRAAVRWVRENAAKYGIDPDRIGVYGGSAGGHLAHMVAVDSRTGIKASCVWFGGADFTNGPGNDGGFVRFLGASFEERPDLYREASPVTHVTKDDPPTLIFHGELDAVVPIRHSQAMVKALRDAGVEAELVTVKNANHGFMGKDVSPPPREIGERTVEFFVKRLKK